MAVETDIFDTIEIDIHLVPPVHPADDNEASQWDDAIDNAGIAKGITATVKKLLEKQGLKGWTVETEMG